VSSGEPAIDLLILGPTGPGVDSARASGLPAPSHRTRHGCRIALRTSLIAHTSSRLIGRANGEPVGDMRCRVGR